MDIKNVNTAYPQIFIYQVIGVQFKYTPILEHDCAQYGYMIPVPHKVFKHKNMGYSRSRQDKIIQRVTKKDIFVTFVSLILIVSSSVLWNP